MTQLQIFLSYRLDVAVRLTEGLALINYDSGLGLPFAYGSSSAEMLCCGSMLNLQPGQN